MYAFTLEDHKRHFIQDTSEDHDIQPPQVLLTVHDTSLAY